MISIDNSVWKLLNDAPNAYTIKIFFFIATNQPQDGIRGFRSTKIQIQIDLKENRTNVFRALKWLRENLLIQELKLADDFDFMANPYFIMNNSDRNERIAEWNRRCDLFIQRKNRLRKEKRLRELRNAKKQ